MPSFIRCFVAALVLCVVGMTGCSDPGTKTVAPIEPLPVFTTTTYTGTVMLPTGSHVSVSKVSVINSVTGTSPSSSGAFTITSYNNGSQIAIVLSPAGTPMLMGFLDATHTMISADTTAQVLAFYALGGTYMLTDADRATYLTGIPQLPGFAALSKAVSTELVANTEAFGQPDANLTAALGAFFTSVTGIKGKSRTGGVKPDGLLIDPGNALSGITVLQMPPDQAYTSNAYRRRSHAFVTRVSEKAAGVTTPDPAAVTDFEIAPTSGVNGGVGGAIIDIFNAYFGNQPTEYAPITSDPFSVPLVGMNDQTNYQVLVVGPGGQNLGAVSTLTAAQESERLKVSIGGFAEDALIPFLSNFALGSGILPDTTRIPSATVQEFKENLIEDLTADFLNLIGSAPQLQQEILAGDYRSAMQDLYTLTVGGSTFNGIYLDAVTKASTVLVSQGFSPGEMSSALDKFNIILNAAGGVLQVFDTGVYATQIAGSDAVDTWTIAATNPKVTLTPASTTLNGVGNQLLTAAVPGVDTTGYSYHWQTTSTVGYLGEVGGSNRSAQTDYCSSSPEALYSNTVPNVAALTGPATDTITVTVFSGGNCKPGAQAGVTVAQVGSPTMATVTTDPTQGIVNGDFSNGLTAWNQYGSPGTSIFINTSIYYMNEDCYPAQEGNPFVQMGAGGTQVAWIQQTFTVPTNAKTLSLRAWNNLDPVTAVISIIDSGGTLHKIDTFVAPSVQKLSDPNNYYSVVPTGNIAVTKTYDISAYAGKSITIRLEGDGLPNVINGYYINYDDIIVK